MNYTVVMLPLAMQEADNAANYYETEQPGLGMDFSAALEKALDSLAQHPAHYSYISSQKNLRDLSLQRFPYKLIYEIRAERVIIFSVHHNKRKPFT